MFPGEIRVAGFPVKVFFRSDEFMAGEFGRWYPDKRYIFINDDMDYLAKWETLLHESMHVISDLYRLSLTEEQVHTQSIAMFEFFTHNKIILEDFIKCQNSVNDQKTD